MEARSGRPTVQVASAHLESIFLVDVAAVVSGADFVGAIGERGQ